jgi:ParB-like nuclease domain
MTFGAIASNVNSVTLLGRIARKCGIASPARRSGSKRCRGPLCWPLRRQGAQVAAIAASIKEWGWTSPALVGEDGGLIAGHARVLAARQLGIAEIPVMVAAGWSEAQKRAYVLADNQLAITGSGWDPELLLRLELGELNLAGFDLSLCGRC